MTEDFGAGEGAGLLFCEFELPVAPVLPPEPEVTLELVLPLDVEPMPAEPEPDEPEPEEPDSIEPEP